MNPIGMYWSKWCPIWFHESKLKLVLWNYTGQTSRPNYSVFIGEKQQPVWIHPIFMSVSLQCSKVGCHGNIFIAFSTQQWFKEEPNISEPCSSFTIKCQSSNGNQTKCQADKFVKDNFWVSDMPCCCVLHNDISMILFMACINWKQDKK